MVLCGRRHPVIFAHYKCVPDRVSTCVNLPLHHKAQRFSSGSGSPWLVSYLVRNVQINVA